MTDRPKARPKRPPKPHPISAPDAWLMKNAMTLSATCGPLDEVRRRMDRKWGIDRLPQLVAPELAQRFGSRVEAYDRAIAECDLETALDMARRLIAAYQHLDAAAEAAGHQTATAVGAWPVEVNGDPAMICAPENARAVQEAFPGVTVFTTDEVGRLVGFALKELWKPTQAVKSAFPGAEVLAMRNKPAGRRAEPADEIPF